jgi:hypothetical protein
MSQVQKFTKREKAAYLELKKIRKLAYGLEKQRAIDHLMLCEECCRWSGDDCCVVCGDDDCKHWEKDRTCDRDRKYRLTCVCGDN